MEENEEVLFKIRAKLFRFEKKTNEWKERGIGDAKFLKHKDSGKIRILMRREKTLKICANHFLLPEFKLTEHVGSDRAWVWTCPSDFSEEESREEVFAIRLTSPEAAKQFKSNFENCQKEMAKFGKLESKDLDKELEKLQVSDKKAEEKGEQKS